MSDGDPVVKRPPGPQGGPKTRTNHAELKRRRVRAGLTLDELGELAGASKGFLSQVEKGKNSAGYDLLSRLAAVLGCDVTDLMADTNGNGPHN